MCTLFSSRSGENAESKTWESGEGSGVFDQMMMGRDPEMVALELGRERKKDGNHLGVLC